MKTLFNNNFLREHFSNYKCKSSEFDILIKLINFKTEV